MANANDIREWGKANGWNVVDGERLPTGLRSAYDNRDLENDIKGLDEFPGLDYPTEQLEEIAPQIHEDSATDKAKGFLARIKKATPAPVAKTRGRKPLRARMSVEKVISMGWRTLANIVAPIQGGALLPVARILEIQAPVAGMVLEDVVKGTIVDRLLQPMARMQNGGEIAFAMMGPPLIVAALTLRPNMYSVLQPALREALKLWIDVAGDKMEEVAVQEAKFQEQYGKRIDELIETLFAPPPGMGPNE